MPLKELGLAYYHNNQIASGKETPTKERSEIMGLSRKFLSALGIEDEKAEQIWEAHKDTINVIRNERDDFKDKAEKFDTVQKQLNDANKMIEDYENNDNNAWKVKYDALREENEKLKSDFEGFKAETTAKETKSAKEKAYRDLLKEAGVSEKRIDSVLKVTDLDKIELDDEGKIKDTDSKKKDIQTEWADFITSESTKGAETSTPPQNTGGAEPRKSRAAELVAKYRSEHYGNEPSKEE